MANSEIKSTWWFGSGNNFCLDYDVDYFVNKTRGGNDELKADGGISIKHYLNYSNMNWFDQMYNIL